MTPYRKPGEVPKNIPIPGPEITFSAEDAAKLAQFALDEKARASQEKVDSIDVKKIWEEIIFSQIEKAAKDGRKSIKVKIEKPFFDPKERDFRRQPNREETEVLKRLSGLLQNKGFDVSFEKGEFRHEPAYQLTIGWKASTSRLKAMPKIVYICAAMVIAGLPALIIYI